jgi:prepilin-type processing-associated H-X9-DG protein
MRCQNNLKQIALGVLTFESTYERFPPSYTREPDHNMLAFILPYVDLQALYDQVDFEHDWSASSNRAVRTTDVGLFVCPSTPTGERRTAITDYATNEIVTAGVRNILLASELVSNRKSWENVFRPGQVEVKAGDVADGLSNTFLIFEDAGRPYGYEDGKPTGRETVTGARWMDDDVFYWIHDLCHGQRMQNCNNNNETYSFHLGGCNYAYGDGSVHFISDAMAAEPYISLFTLDAGDHVPAM